MTFVRTAVGPNARPGLEIVRIAAIPNKGGPVLVRATKPFAPLGSNTTLLPNSDFANPIVLLRSPYLVSFAYAGRDRIWKRPGKMPTNCRPPFASRFVTRHPDGH